MLCLECFKVSRNDSGRDSQAGLQLLREGSLNVNELVTHEFKLDNVGGGVKDLQSRLEHSIMTVLRRSQTQVELVWPGSTFEVSSVIQNSHVNISISHASAGSCLISGSALSSFLNTFSSLPVEELLKVLDLLDRACGISASCKIVSVAESLLVAAAVSFFGRRVDPPVLLPRRTRSSPGLRACCASGSGVGVEDRDEDRE